MIIVLANMPLTCAEVHLRGALRLRLQVRI